MTGHHYDATEVTWNGIPVMYTGASERMSKNDDSTDRVAWLLTVDGELVDIEQYDIP